jgi:hypothetical protein
LWPLEPAAEKDIEKIEGQTGGNSREKENEKSVSFDRVGSGHESEAIRDRSAYFYHQLRGFGENIYLCLLSRLV